MKNVRKVNSGDGCITTRVYLIVLNCTLKHGKFYVVYIYNHNKHLKSTTAGRKGLERGNCAVRGSWSAERRHAEKREAETSEGPERNRK